jgi:large subunit ribosomal protein L23
MKVLIKPIITEKATRGSELSNCYTFFVDPRANKLEIKTAVENTYNVTVAKVQSGKTNATKRAVVQVVEGDAIDFYSNL